MHFGKARPVYSGGNLHTRSNSCLVRAEYLQEIKSFTHDCSLGSKNYNCHRIHA